LVNLDNALPEPFLKEAKADYDKLK